MSDEQWTIIFRKAASKAGYNHYVQKLEEFKDIAIHISDEDLMYVVNKKPEGEWVIEWLRAVEEELENRVDSIILEDR